MTVSPCGVRDSTLRYGPDTEDIWAQLVEDESLGTLSGGDELRTHLSLYGCPELDDEALLDSLAAPLDGYMLIRPGINGVPDPVLLCTGTPQSCPTTAAEVAEGKHHDCDGLLGGFGGRVAVQDTTICWVPFLYLTAGQGGSLRESGEWASSRSEDAWGCPSEDEREARAVWPGHDRTAAETAPARTPRDPDGHFPELEESVRSTASLQRKVSECNRRVLRSYTNGKLLHYVVGGGQFLIGSTPELVDQNPHYLDWARSDPDHVTGKLMIGDLTWRMAIHEDVPAGAQDVVRQAVRDFAPNYTVYFGPPSPGAEANPSAESILEGIRGNLERGHITAGIARKKAEGLRAFLYLGRVRPAGRLADLERDLTSFIAEVKREVKQLGPVGNADAEDPTVVHSSLSGWATRCEEPLGTTTEAIVNNLIERRGRRVMPRAYRGACYTTAYVLKENLCGRPTDFAFTRDTEVVHMGSKHRTQRLGRPVLMNATADDLRKFVARAPRGTLFEIGAYDKESGHAIVAVAPDVFLDVENSVPSGLVLEMARKMGKDSFAVWKAGKLAEGISVDSRATT
ncbi:hypothetical protein ACFQ78_19715 [Streptomyces sp. NPDC056519]|uniref:hypothetical protein n=1 Tax=Streptomyces sp. NPDC056519 TaxID=3345849 RepID=UPI00368FECC4